ncbi:hypothetical protein WGC32_08355 [Zongyangia sp. HA2173]|uniref:hypothetical protein n=1 Tax=Zongyangia sp. HA2173 TaxID=3133035 RepID=UPI003169C34D
MDKEMLEQFQILFQAIQDVKNEVKESETRINLKIENEVSKRIEALFDGYKLTHEKQWELERKTDLLQQQINDLQARLSALENQTA